jgi:hypothetical protein
MLDLPFKVNLFIYISLASLLLGIIILLFFIFSHAVRTTGKFSFIKNTFRFTLILLWILVSAVILVLASFIQSYQSFTKKELVAVVRCIPLDDEVNTMRMEIKLLKNGGILEERKIFTLKGDQWAIEGDVLKWDDWANILGIHTMYRLTRVRGRYLNVREEIQTTPTVYSLVENEEDWQWLYNYGHKLPFVTAVYGNTVFTYPSKEKAYEIYVTTSGFMAQVMETKPNK